MVGKPGCGDPDYPSQTLWKDTDDEYGGDNGRVGLLQRLQHNIVTSEAALPVGGQDITPHQCLRTEVDEQIVYSALEGNENAIWSLFLASGYLKMEGYTFCEDKTAVSYLNQHPGNDYPIQVDISSEAEATQILADEQLLQRVLENLIGNSIRHNPNGCSIEIDARITDGQYQITRRDFPVE